GFFIEERNLATKEGTMSVRNAVEDGPLHELQRELEAGGGSLMISGIPGVPQPRTAKRMKLEFTGSVPGAASGDAVEACERYLRLLHRIVDEFEATLPKAPSA